MMRERSREKESVRMQITHSLESFEIDSSSTRLLSVEETSVRIEDRSLILSEGGEATREED